jgi:hypothetical protein
VTGFLQRIAAAAIRPEPRLKPLVGSIFAGEPSMDFAEEKRSLLLDPPRVARPQASSQPAPEGIETRATHAPEQSARDTPVHHEPLIATPQPFPPSLASVVSQLTAPKQTVAAAAAYELKHGDSNGTAAELGAAFLPAQHSGRTEQPSRPAAASSVSQQSELRVAQFTPVATHQELPLMPVATHRELPQPATSAAKKPGPQLAPGQMASQPNTSEEIQIHIGRIEVIAVPPPGAAAPPTPRSRATRLDDYLRRRNGGGG